MGSKSIISGYFNGWQIKIMANEKHIPALGFGWLTPLYDPVVQLTTREKTFKKALVEQTNFKAGQTILDLACGVRNFNHFAKTKKSRYEHYCV